jgi:peroxiredoxin/mono/diheme cytochrome c family protein
MSRPYRIALAFVVAALAGPARADEERPLGRLVGQTVPNFTLRDALTGQPVSLYSFRGKQAAVLFYSGLGCPIGDLYLPRLERYAKEYGPKGVVFLTINANPGDTDEAIRAQEAKEGRTLPVLRDTKREVADNLEVERTCETLVLDGRARLRFRGAIDDQYDYGGKRRAEPSRHYLKDALDGLLAGRDLDVTATSVAGCPLEPKPNLTAKLATVERVRAPSDEIVAAQDAADGPEPEVGAVSWSGEVAAIVQDRCQNCHRPGQSGPFDLLSYDDARRRAAGIAEVVAERRMPPWHADPRHGKFANDRHLSPKERATLLAWVEQGTPLGDPAKAPAPKSWVDGWNIGQPDQVIELPEEYIVKADGTLNYQYFVVPSGFTEDRWIQAAEARPTDRGVVHHIIVYLQVPGQPRDRGPGVHLCGYAPGDMPTVLPPGTAKRIPKGANFVFQVHYTPNGKVRKDRSALGLIFAKTPPTTEAITHGIANPKFAIPPGDANYEVKDSWRTRRDITLLAFMPHMHLRGKDFQYDAVYPDGRRETLLKVPAYDFAWQSYYTLAEPLKLPAGTRIDCVAHYDNSEGNRVNPDPTDTVRWGDQTWQEMMIGYIDYTVPIPEDQRPKGVAAD